MFRRTLPAVALTTLALVASAFALNRPGERVAIEFDRVAKAAISKGWPDIFEVRVEGRVINPRGTYCRPTEAMVFAHYPGPRPSGPHPGAVRVGFGLNFDLATGRFEGGGELEFPLGLRLRSLLVELHDETGRIFARPLTFDP